MASWRPAKCLIKLRDQIDALAPERDKSSDGLLGDAAHAARASDHNPNAAGVVTAIDISHDPAHGVDTYALAELLRTRRDHRAKYIISNRRICSATVSPWEWRPYNGTNPHTHHVHISAVADPALYDDASPWDIALSAPIEGAPAQRLRIKRGDTGPYVTELQTHLGLVADGVFGEATETAVRTLQAARGLAADGIVGPYTWDVVLDPSPNVVRESGITATVFGGSGDLNRSAYDNHVVTDDELGVALPYRFPGARPKVRVTKDGRSVTAEIVDVGPWNTDDPYWQTGTRPQAESGTDKSGRSTNHAGIDLTPAAARAIGLAGKGAVDWEFVAPEVIHPPTPPAPQPTSALDPLLRPIMDEALTKIIKVMEAQMAQVPAVNDPNIAKMFELMMQFMTHGNTPAPVVQPPVLSPIDKALGGQATVNLKTPAGILGLVGSIITGVMLPSGSDWMPLVLSLITGFGGLTGLGLVAKVDRFLKVAIPLAQKFMDIAPQISAAIDKQKASGVTTPLD